MANQATKKATVWNPPRLFKLTARTVGSTAVRQSTEIWEGGATAPGSHCTKQYRMPSSSEPVSSVFLEPYCPV